MDAQKLKKKELLTIKIDDTESSSASEYHPTESMDSPPPKSKKKKNVMQLGTKRKGVSKKSKKCLRSRDKQACLHDSKNSQSSTRKRARYIDMYDDVEAMFSIMERAERSIARLENGLPYFVKCMLPSNVAHGFWLHLPKKFCSLHLPKHDASIVLVDEWGNEYKTSYLLGRIGLSAGWRGFAISHRLLKGDILVFRLTEPCKLKVHIVRVNGLDVVDAALCLMNLDASRTRRRTDTEVAKKGNRKHKQRKYVEPFLLDNSKSAVDVTGENTPSYVHGRKPVIHHSASNTQGFTSEVHEGSHFTNQPQPENLCYPGASILHDHPHKGITCR